MLFSNLVSVILGLEGLDLEEIKSRSRVLCLETEYFLRMVWRKHSG